MQYAHARAASVMRHAAEQFARGDLSDAALAAAPLERLTDPAEMALIRQLAAWPRLVEGAAEAHEPHRDRLLSPGGRGAVPRAVEQRAGTRRHCASSSPPIRELTRARLALVRGVAIVIASGLAVFGVEPAEEM